MKQFLKLALNVLIMALILGACAQSGNESNTNKIGENKLNPKNRSLAFTDTVAFIAAEGDTVAAIEVAIADEQRERSRGLMGITNLGSNQGMLFIFEKEKPLSFWMANTPLSLDIIFVNAEKEIVRIHHSTPPFSQKNFKSGQPALYAIETNGGFAIDHDIREGMTVRF